MIEKEEKDTTNYAQTEFTFEEPLFQKRGGEPSVASPMSPVAEAPVKKKPTLILIVALVAGLLLLVIGLLAIAAPAPTEQQRQVQASPAASLDPVANPLRQRLNTLDDQLKQADPARPPLTFPPVEMVIELESRQR